jgi:hypothetical protein
VKAFDSCFSCFGQNPSPSWFQQQKAAGYQLAIMDPDSWNSEFPNGNASRPGPASGCALSSNGLDDIDNAITAGMYVGLYNRNINCYRQTLNSLGSYEQQGVRFYVWDIETDPGQIPTQAQLSEVAGLGYANVVYTWDGAVRNLGTSFAGLPLWMNEVSNWNTPNAGPPTNNYPHLDSISPFNGWSSAVIEQISTGKLNGMSVDFDSADAAWLSSLG